MADSTRKDGLPECPRCGYDLSGQVLAWQESCPLEGVCSECGLGLEYRYILNRGLAAQWRFFEVALSGRMRAFRTTASRCFFPRDFWSWVRIEFPINTRRLAFGVIGAGVGWYLLWVVVWACVSFGLTLGLAALFEDLAWFPFGEVAVQALLSSLGAPLSDSHYASLGYAECPRMAAFTCIGVITSLVIPFCFLALPDTLRRARVRRMHLVRIAAWAGAGLPAIFLCSSVFLGLAEDLLWALEMRSGAIIHVSAVEFIAWARGPLVLLVVIAWLARWWHAACRFYLKLAAPLAVTLAMLVMAVLAALICSMLIPGVGLQRVR